MKKLKLAVLASAFLASGAALAQAKPAEPDYTLSANVGVVSDYRYRGISQTRLKPALQGGADFAHKSGFYVGTWASTIKWIEDTSALEPRTNVDGPVEVVPLDVFLKLAASKQTYTTRYQDPEDPKHFHGYKK